MVVPQEPPELGYLESAMALAAVVFFGAAGLFFKARAEIEQKLDDLRATFVTRHTEIEKGGQMADAEIYRIIRENEKSASNWREQVAREMVTKVDLQRSEDSIVARLTGHMTPNRQAGD